MKPLVLIQARTDSKRLPNKILLKINNKELILKLYERVKLYTLTNCLLFTLLNNFNS